MPVVTLPDGSQRSFDKPVSVHDVAADIGPGLAKAALAGKVDGRDVDTSYVIEGDAQLAIVTERDEAGLDLLRHSTAHLLAMATQELFPGVQVTIGPVIEDGFYYDFASGHTFTPEDLEKIEKRMAEIVKDDIPVERVVMDRAQAIKTFREMGEHYKVQIIEELPEGEEISLYKQGAWMDLCRGPHVPSTGKLQAGDKAIGIAEWLFASPRGRVGTLGIGDLTEEEIRRMKVNAARVTVVNFEGESTGYGHDYFRTNPAVSSDLVLKIRYGLKPGEAGRPLEYIGLNFWRVPEGYPANAKTE